MVAADGVDPCNTNGVLGEPVCVVLQHVRASTLTQQQPYAWIENCCLYSAGPEACWSHKTYSNVITDSMYSMYTNKASLHRIQLHPVLCLISTTLHTDTAASDHCARATSYIT